MLLVQADLAEQLPVDPHQAVVQRGAQRGDDGQGWWGNGDGGGQPAEDGFPQHDLVAFPPGEADDLHHGAHGQRLGGSGEHLQTVAVVLDEEQAARVVEAHPAGGADTPVGGL